MLDMLDMFCAFQAIIMRNLHENNVFNKIIIILSLTFYEYNNVTII